MDDDPDHPTPPQPAPEEWLKILEESDADLAAGRVVPYSVIKAELDETIAAIEAKLARKQQAIAPERS